ncbi:MAG: hypothetical protein K0Q73_6671 [Paenibacillus sp.]|nr:hypothetical protein [Paenibacillus sp.]
MSSRPTVQEYSSYFETYVALVPDGDIQDILTRQQQTTNELFSNLSEERANTRYAPEKWSIKESYRLLRIARGDKTPLTGYDQDELMNGASFSNCSLSELLEDYNSVRRATLTLLKGLSGEAWSRTGIVNSSESTANAWAYILAGHERHHVNVVLKKYLNQ